MTLSANNNGEFEIRKEYAVIYNWKKGISLSFFRNEKNDCIGADPDVLCKVKENDFECVELSFSHDDYFNRYHFTEGDTAEELYHYCRSLGLELWSIHLPFSEKWDLSRENAEEALGDFEELIKAASRADISVAVLHPSFEPVLPEERAQRMIYAKKNIKLLNEAAKDMGVVLALENLPRTCLGNCSKEMLDLLQSTDTKFIFDTNHSLLEENSSFLSFMIDQGYCPVSLHISDYDFSDERHELPGYGKNKWNEILDILKKAGYQGPALYEPALYHMSGEKIDLNEISQNVCDLLQGKIF